MTLQHALMYQDAQNQIWLRFCQPQLDEAQQQLQTLKDSLSARYDLYQWRYAQQNQGQKYQLMPTTGRSRRISSGLTTDDFSDSPSDSAQSEKKPKLTFGQRLKSGIRSVFSKKGSRRASSSDGVHPKEEWINRMASFMVDIDSWTAAHPALSANVNQGGSIQPVIQAHLV